MLGTRPNIASIVVNDSPSVTFTGLTDLTLNALAGDDDIRVDVNSLSVADFSIDGGQSAGDGDSVLVTANAGLVGGLPQQHRWTPAASDAGDFEIVGQQTLELIGLESFTFDGQGDDEALFVHGNNLDNTIVHHPGIETDAGMVVVDFDLAIRYQNLGGAASLVVEGQDGVDTLVATGTDLSDVANVGFPNRDQSVFQFGNVTGGHVVLESTSVEAHRIDLAGGDDTLDINSPVDLFGFLTVLGGDNGDGSDTLNFIAAPVATTVDFEFETISQMGFADTLFDGFEHLNVDASGQDLTVNATSNDDDVTVTPLGSDSGRLTIDGHDTSLFIENTAVFTIDTRAGENTLTVRSTSGPDSVVVNGTSVAVGAREIVNYLATTGDNSLTVMGLDGDDAFTVTPSAVIPMFIDGGDPIGVGDTLEIIAADSSIYSPGTENDDGSFEVDALQPVSFDHIEMITITGDGDLAATVLGTSNDDQITVVGTDPRDADVSVNAGPMTTYTGLDNLSVESLAGDDNIDVVVNNLGIGTFTVDAGDPVTDEDEVTVAVITAGSAVTWNPANLDAGELETELAAVPLSQNLSLVGVEQLVVDGEAGDLQLIVNGTAADNTIVHQPGDAIDRGAVAVDTLLTIQYVDLGKEATVLVQDLVGADTLVALGTANSDEVNIAFPLADDAIDLDLIRPFGTHIDLLSAAVENYKTSVLGGNDTVNVTGKVRATGTFGVAGDEAGSDVLNLIGSRDGAAVLIDDLLIEPIADSPGEQDISGLGSDIRASGIERITFEGRDSDDSLLIDLGAGDNRARVERGDLRDIVFSDSMPPIEFTGLESFAIRGNVGSNEVTFKTRDLAGAMPQNYLYLGTSIDTLILEGTDGAVADRFTLSNPSNNLVAQDHTGNVVALTAEGLGHVVVDSLGGDDEVMVDVGSFDLISPQITFDGGFGSDLLTVTGAPFTAVDEVTYRPGPAITEGRLQYENAGNTALMTIDFVNLEPVIDSVVAANLTVNGTFDENDISYGPGAAADRGQVNVDGFERIEFNNKTSLNLNGLGGGDTIVLDNATLPTELETIMVNGGVGEDNIDVIDLPDASATSFVSATVNGDDGDDRIDGSHLVANTPLTINGGRGRDVLLGGRGNDTINGGGQDDVLVGGDPTLTTLIGDNVYDGGAGYDQLYVLATDASDTVDVVQSAAATLVSTVNGNAFNERFSNLESALINARGREDVVQLTVSDTLFDVAENPNATVLAYTIDGGPTSTGDRLVVIDDGLGDTVIHRQSLVSYSGSVSIAPNHGNGAAPAIEYLNAERVDITPVNNITGRLGADGSGRLFTFKADPLEANDQLPSATFLGAGETLNLDPTIDPGVGRLASPADEDWYEFVVEKTGTLDLQVYFESQGVLANGRSGLPGNGDLNAQVYDAAGNLISGFGSNENAADDTNERLRIPVVQGETYYLRVYGGSGDAVNVYSLSAVNEAPPVPYDLEINDILQSGTVAVGPATAFGFTATFAPYVSVLVPTDFDYVGKTVEFTSGANIGRSALITDFDSGTGVFDVGVGLAAAPSTGDTFLVETTDTGRSHVDDVTRDNTPIITLRLDDDRLLNDVPGTPSTQSPPDEEIPIPFNSDQSAAIVAGAGYRVAVFVEGAPQQASQLPQVPVGYARQVAGTTGIYTFDFATDAIGGPFVLTDGSHFISAKVEIIDPSTPTVYGFGDRSESLELVIDAESPIAYFGDPAIANDGLHADSDSGDNFVPATLNDRVTNDTTPTFFGVAEANSVVRAYVDLDGSLTVTPQDVLIGQTVASPLDGDNQHPFGQWEITSAYGMNDPNRFGTSGVDGVRNILITAEDLAGNVTDVAQRLEIFIDTAGPNVTDVYITSDPGYALFTLKPSNVVQGPTPRVDSLTIDIRDLPERAAGFLYQALSNVPPLPPVVLTGDHSGVIAITQLGWNSNPVVAESVAAGSIVLTFAEPLPDDRYTLTLGDSVIDPAGNALDGETNAVEPIGTPVFPTGDGIPGGDFLARFTVDSRPEVATWSQGIVYVDINGNLVWDPEGEDNDETNRDFAYNFGELTDAYFAGNFATAGAVSASGFDKIGAYGAFNGVYQFFIDTNDDGVGDTVGSMAFQVNAIPVAGDFSAAHPGNEIGAFDGQNWYLDVNGNNQIDGNERFSTPLRGLPVVGDFNGDGQDDLATFNNDSGEFLFDLNRDHSTINDSLTYGFSGFGEFPIAGDVNLDGADDIVLWVPGREGQLPKESGEFHFLLSDNVPANPTTRTLPSNVFESFSPRPLGNDLVSQFGDEFALPIIGNFDPPVASDAGAVIGSLTNNINRFDTNVDGHITALDTLEVINVLSRSGDLQLHQPLRAAASLGGRLLDVSEDGAITPIDALMVINRMVQLRVEAESIHDGSAEKVNRPLVDAVVDSELGVDFDDELYDLLVRDQQGLF